MSKPPPIRIGLIGCGDYGRKVQLPNLLAMDRVRVTALYNRTQKHLDEAMQIAGEAGQKPIAADSWQQLVSDANVDAVVVSLPPEFNWPIVKAADAAGKAVLIEKPIAADIDDLHAIDTLARKRRIHIQVGTQMLWSDFYTRLEREVRAMGDVLAVRSDIYHSDSWVLEPMTWKVDSQASGGMLNSWGAHPLTMMLKLAGGSADHPGDEADYDELSAFTGVAFERDGVDPAMYDTVSAAWLTLGHHAGHAVPCHIQYAVQPQVKCAVWRIDVTCTQGRIEGDVQERTLRLCRGRQAQDVALPPFPGTGYDGNRQALDFFVNCVAEGRVDLCSLRLGITACRFAMEVNVSPSGEDEAEMDLEPTPAPPPAPPPRPRRTRKRPRRRGER